MTLPYNQGIRILSTGGLRSNTLTRNLRRSGNITFYKWAWKKLCISLIEPWYWERPYSRTLVRQAVVLTTTRYVQENTIHHVFTMYLICIRARILVRISLASDWSRWSFRPIKSLWYIVTFTRIRAVSFLVRFFRVAPQYRELSWWRSY